MLFGVLWESERTVADGRLMHIRVVRKGVRVVTKQSNLVDFLLAPGAPFVIVGFVGALFALHRAFVMMTGDRYKVGLLESDERDERLLSVHRVRGEAEARAVAEKMAADLG